MSPVCPSGHSVDIGPLFEQQIHHLLMSTLAGKKQGFWVPQFQVGPSLDLEIHDLQVAFVAGSSEPCYSEQRLSGDIGTFIYEPSDFTDVTSLHGNQ